MNYVPSIELTKLTMGKEAIFLAQLIQKPFPKPFQSNTHHYNLTTRQLF